MKTQIKVLISEGDKITKTVPLIDIKNGTTQIIAPRGAKIVLADETTGKAPKNITVKRLGSDLHIGLDGSDPDDVDLIIENYYGSDASLIGLGEDGAYHSYTAADGEGSHFIAGLEKGAGSAQVLGTDNLGIAGFSAASADANLGMLGWAALGALGVAGLVAATDGGSSRGRSGSGSDTDTEAPGQASITAAIDDVAPHTGTIAHGGVTNDNTPTFNGKAEAHSTVTIYVNGNAVGTTTADANGNWNYTPDPALSDGSHSITVTATDQAGHVGLASAPYVVVIDTAIPSKPEPSAGGIDGVGDDQGTIGNGETTDNGTPTFTGSRGNPGDTVIIVDKGERIGEAMVGEDGTWEFTPRHALDDGPHRISIIVRNQAGNESPPSDEYLIIIATSKAEQPTIHTVIDNVGDDQGNLSSGDTTDDTRPEIRGTAEANSLVSIYNGDNLLDTVRADANGEWAYIPSADLVDGLYTLHVTAQGANGTISDPSNVFEFNLIADSTPPTPAPTPTIHTVIDNVGDDQGDLSSGDTTDDTRPEIRGTAEANSLVSIYNGDKLMDTVRADANGEWVYIPSADLVDGLYTLHVTAQGADGTISEPSNVFEFNLIAETITPTPEPAPTIYAVVDNVGDDKGYVVSGDTTDDARPEIRGTAEAHSLVSIYNGDTLLGTVSANEAGRWVYIPSTDLPNGEYKLHVTAQGTNGNVSEPSNTFEFNLISEGTPPAPTPVITTIIDSVGEDQGDLVTGDTTDDARPEIRGTTEAHSLVSIYNGDTLLNTVRADASGNWVYTPQTDLPDGLYQLHAIAQSADGTISDPSNVFEFTLIADSTPPTPAAKPVIYAAFDNVGDDRGLLVSGETTDDARPEIRGTAEAHSLVTIYNGDMPLGTVRADATGKWAYTPAEDLTDGLYTLRATAQGAGGGVSDPSSDFELNVIAGGTPVTQDITTSDNTLKLSLDDVLAQGDDDLFASDGKSQVMIKDSAGDVVDLTGMLDSTEVGMSGVSYHAYPHSGLTAELLAQDDLTTNLPNG